MADGLPKFINARVLCVVHLESTYLQTYLQTLKCEIQLNFYATCAQVARTMSSTSSPPAKISSSTPPSSVSPEPDDDIWGSDSPSASASPALGNPVRRDEILSDAPLVRRQQLTNGYREGVSIGKAQTMQDGFDQGYPLGAEIGLKVGYIKGVLEGIILSLVKAGNSQRAEQMRKQSKNIIQNLQVGEFLRGVEDQIVSEEEERRTPKSDEQNSDLTFVSEPASSSAQVHTHSDEKVKDLFCKSAMNYLDKLENDVEALLNNINKQTRIT